MAAAVLQFDMDALPGAVRGLDGYDSALVLVRHKASPIALFTLAVNDGVLEGAALRAMIAEHGGARLVSLEALERLGHRSTPATDASDATVAICTQDRPADLDRCLSAVAGLASTGHEVLVIDSASADEEPRRVVERHPGVRYVREDRPGLDIARNRALREARGHVVVFSDDDAVPDRHWLGAMLSNFGDPRTLCVTGLTLPLELETEAQEWFERTNSFSRGLERRRYDGAVDDPFLVGQIGAGVNMALRRSVLDLVGPFDEALDAGTATRSGGDHDMLVRILLGGYCIVYEPRAISQHRHRSDWPGVRETVQGYGTGVYAHLSKHLIEAGETRAIGVALGWGRGQLRNLVRAILRRPNSPPLGLILAELRGCVAGPRAYRVARRRLRDAGAPDTGSTNTLPEAGA